MKIDAIVYVSNSGFTKKYAEYLSTAIGVPAFSLDEAKSKVAKKADIVFMGWLMAGGIKGYKKANKLYNVKALCGVGMGTPTDSEHKRISSQNNCPADKFFLLQGGFDLNKLHGIYKFMMTAMKKTAGKALSDKADKTPEDEKMLDLMLNGGDCTSLENLAGVIEFLK